MLVSQNQQGLDGDFTSKLGLPRSGQMPTSYILPITKIHTSFDEAKEFYDKYKGIIFFEEEILPFSDLTKGNRNLIAGEPGIGKTSLLLQVKAHFESNGFTTQYIELKQNDSPARTEHFVSQPTKGNKALFLDGLDEVRASLLSSVIETIVQISDEHPSLPIFHSFPPFMRLKGRRITSRYSDCLTSYQQVTGGGF